MKKVVLTLSFCLFSLLSFSQRKADVVMTFEKNLDDLIQSPETGIIVVKDGSVLRGISPESNAEEWKYKVESKATLSNIANAADFLSFTKNRELLKAIEGTPYVEALVDNNTVIINTATGKPVFNSSNYPYIVFDVQYLYGDDEVLVKGNDGTDVVMTLIDLKSGTERWKTKIGSLKALLGASLSFNGDRQSNSVVAKGNMIYSLYYGKVAAIDRPSGKVLWESKEFYSKIIPTQNSKNLIAIQRTGGMLSTKQALNVLDSYTGKSIWEDEIKTKRIVLLEDWGDKLMVAHWSGFNFYNLSDGSKIWKKDARGDGLKKVISIDNDYLYVAENEMMLINRNGEKLWKKFIEISDNKEDDIVYLGKVEDKVMYVTDTYGNMVDYKTGQKLWRRNMKFNEKRPTMTVFDEETKSFIVYNDEELFKFNPSISDKPDAFAKVNVKREKELNGIEIFPWGVSLSGPIEVLGVGKDGQVKYQKTYSQPGEVGRSIMKGLGRVGQVAGTVATAQVTVTVKDEKGNTVAEGTAQFNDNIRAAGFAGMVAGSELASANRKRFNAMKQNHDYSLIFAKDEASEAKVLVKVRKSDGVEVDKLIFENNKPQYEVDPLTESIYYIKDNRLNIYFGKK